MRAAGASAALRLSCLGYEIMSTNGGFVLESSCWSDSYSSSGSEDNGKGVKRKIERKDLYCSEEATAWDDYGPLDKAPFTQEQDLSQQ